MGIPPINKGYSSGLKYDTSKLRWDLVPFEVLDKVVQAFTYGAIKYADNSWQCLDNFNDRYFAAMMRHISAYRKGEWLDFESKLPHLTHAAWNALALLWKGKKERNKNNE